MTLEELLLAFLFGTAGGFIVNTVFSLLGYSFYKTLKWFK